MKITGSLAVGNGEKCPFCDTILDSRPDHSGEDIQEHLFGNHAREVADAYSAQTRNHNFDTQIEKAFSELYQDNMGNAKRIMEVALSESGIQESTIVEVFVALKVLITRLKAPDIITLSLRVRFARWLIDATGELDEYYAELLKPFRKVLDYLETEDVTHLCKLQMEYRDLFMPLLGLERVPNPKGFIIRKIGDKNHG